MRNGEDAPAADAGTPPVSSAWADYQGPLMPGRYPPLGYGPDGAAIYQAGTPPQAPTHGPVTGQPGVPAMGGPPVGGDPVGDGPAGGGPAGGGPGGPSDSGRQTPEPPGGKKSGGGSTAAVLGLAAVVVVAALLIGISLVRNSSSSQSDSTQNLPEYEPTVVQPPVIVPGHPGLPDEPGQTQAPGQPGPGGPGAGGSGRSAAGKPVSYDATISGTATILYVDDQGLRTEFSPQHAWHVDFTGGSGPLRMIVLAGGGSSATCTITVDGKVVASDQVSADSPQRTASCFA